MGAPRALLALIFALSSSAGCSSESAAPTPVCTTVDLACTPAYEPTFDNVFTRTLRPTCGIGGAACHTSSGRQGKLVFEDPEVAFDGLMNGKVSPGDPACSAVMVRLTSTDGMVRMPPGRPLDPSEQCAIAKWIEGGAQR
jgi:hypothetical protein